MSVEERDHGVQINGVSLSGGVLQRAACWSPSWFHGPILCTKYRVGCRAIPPAAPDPDDGPRLRQRRKVTRRSERVLHMPSCLHTKLRPLLKRRTVLHHPNDHPAPTMIPCSMPLHRACDNYPDTGGLPVMSLRPAMRSCRTWTSSAMAFDRSWRSRRRHRTTRA